jgi:hypothetical protein
MSAVPFEHCPKCNHAPLPENQALPAACPSCGVIFAKLLPLEASDDAEPVAPTIDESSGEPPFRLRLMAMLLHVPERTDSVSFWSRAILLALFAVWGLRLIVLDYTTGEMMSSFLHGPLLVFHEAGHVIFSFFGEFIMVFGGSFAQLLMPAIMAGALLLRNRDPFGAAIGTWLFGVSLLDLAPYVYDALDPQLILLGGHTGAEGGHDWIYLLSATGLLQRAHGLGWLVHKSGALLILLSLAWAGWILLLQKRRGLA